MNKFLILILIFVSSNSFCQELILKSNILVSGITEKYSVLKANNKIKQGDYTLVCKGDVLINGFYNKDKRDSTWIFYNQSHDTILIYDYSHSKRLYWKCQEPYQSCNNKKTPAFYSYGFDTILQRIVKSLEYPQEMAEKGAQGKAEVSVIINTDGKLLTSFIKKSAGQYKLDIEANKRANESCQGDWIPAINEDNKPIIDTLTFSIAFQLQDQLYE